MEAIGRFASGIAHDFNNVLGGIFVYGEMLLGEAAENTPRKRHAQQVLTAATRGQELVDQILAYSRRERGQRVATDVCSTVAETVELVRSSLPASIALETCIPDAPLTLLADQTQIHQVIMNLCRNAIQAMPSGGSLRVTLTTIELTAERVFPVGTLRAGQYVCTSVEDSGCGMDKATLARIFEPFFTTKQVGRGTGLGLALVYSIVTELCGAIDVKSAPAQGSMFSVYLPLAEPPSPATAA
jgi:signal transduction histidine kinase